MIKGLFEDRPDEFSSMFRRVLSLTLDQTLSTTLRTQLLNFLIHAFQNLDCAIVRVECAPLVSIAIWHNISTDQKRDKLLGQTAHLKKSWRASLKRFDAADDATKSRLKFERSWLYTLLLAFLNMLYDTNKPDEDLYCERFVEFISDLLSQLPTRRYVNSLLADLNVLPAMRLSPVCINQESALLRDLYTLLAHYANFAVDDQTGAQLSRTAAYDKHCADLSRLQRISLKNFKEKLSVLALSNYGAIETREHLQGFLEPLTDDELRSLTELAGLRVSYPETLKMPVDRNFFIECLINAFERRRTFQEQAEKMAVLPTEQSLFDAGFQRSDDYDGSHPLALPKLNLQYLSVGDFLWRTLVLYRAEAYYGIRRDVETALRRLQPELKSPGVTHFSGFSKMAMPVSKAA